MRSVPLMRRRARRMSGLAGLAFGDVDWGAIATATANLTASVLNTAGKSGGTGGGAAMGTCPWGYIWNPSTGRCQQIPGAGPAPGTQNQGGAVGSQGGLFGNLDQNTMLMIGGVALLGVLLIARK